MRKLFFIGLLAASTVCVKAQDNKQFTKRPAVSVAMVFNDFQTPTRIKSSGLGTTLAGKDWRKTRNMVPGIAVGYHAGYNDYLDYSLRVAGSFTNYPNALVNKNLLFGQDRLLLEFDASAQLKLLSDNYWVSPYISAGIGGSKYKGYYGAFAPIGLGMQVNFYDETFLFVNTQYRQAITENVTNHLFYSLGVAGNVGKTKPLFKPMPVPTDIPTVKAPMDPDTDGDGVSDSKDKCKDVAGLEKYEGCPIPDSDNDGVNDEEDKCKDQAGSAKYGGCPIPDTDGDGLNDEEDKCINIVGTAKYKGCPMPDKDSDGIADEEDKCPEVAGIAENNGCPKVDEAIIKKVAYAAEKIYFATGKSTLLPASFKSLNTIVKILQDNPELKIDIEGHTDNKGDATKNQVLSQKRAEAVLAYVKSKGIAEDRLVATGYGSEQPRETNDTPAGRQKNRRVELKVNNN